MIVNHDYRYIFLKTRKTAGSSVKLALLDECGPDDLITPMRPEGVVGQNYTVALRNRSGRELLKALLGTPTIFHVHTQAFDARRWLGPGIWNSYFKFTIERNPWDRYVSQYTWNTRKGGKAEGMDMHAHFDWTETFRKSNWDIYAIGDDVVADKVIRYENLAADLKDVTARLGMKDLDLPFAKSGYRPKKQHYSKILPDDLAERIRTICAREIRYMGYEY